MHTALVLSGGGARGAYQVGALHAVADILPPARALPFSILAGASAGRITSAFLAARAHDFPEAVRRLVAFWSQIAPHDVFRTDAPTLTRVALGWATDLSLGGWIGSGRGKALLVSDPLRTLLIAGPCLRHAVEVSQSLESALTLLHVMDPPRDRSGLHAADVLDWEIARQEATAYLERLQDDAAHALGRRVDARLEQGHPAERITALARELRADLTVLGSHGERGATAWNLGGTAQQVLAVPRGSVLLVRSRQGAEARAVAPTRILVPLDGSRRTESVLPTVTRLARAHGADLLLVFVAPEPVATAVLSAPHDLEVARDLSSRLEANGRRYLEDLREQLAHEGVSARTLALRNPDGKQSTLALSERERSDLIVLCAHGSTCNPALPFGGVTSHLVAHATVSVLVLQDLGEAELGTEEDDRRAPSRRSTFSEGV